jgi:hypothetical protein
VRTILIIMLLKPGGPLVVNKIIDFYYRIEFQHRVSAHIHVVLWVDAAPIYKEFNKDECIKFITKIIICSDKNNLSIMKKHSHRST